MFKRTGIVMLAMMVSVVALLPLGAQAQQPLTFRFAWGVIPATISPLLFKKPEILKNYRKSYNAELLRFRGTAAHIPALAAKELDFSYMSFGSFAAAILNAKLDIRIIAGMLQDGAPGYFSTHFGVRADAGINSPADLKGKIIGVHVFGTGFHLVMTDHLAKHGLTEGKDYRVVEVRLPHMHAMLQKKVIDLGIFAPPFWSLAKKKGNTKSLFQQKDVIGRDEILFQILPAEILRKHPNEVVDFLEDYLLGIRWYYDPANRKEALAVTAKFGKRPVKSYAGWTFGKNDFYRDLNGAPLIEAIQENLNRYYEKGRIKKLINVHDYLDLSYLHKAQQRVGVIK